MKLGNKIKGKQKEVQGRHKIKRCEGGWEVTHQGGIKPRNEEKETKQK